VEEGAHDEEIDERTLVELARGDPEAFAELYRRYLPRVYAFAYRRTGVVEVAEDITSATFERALRNLDSYSWRAGGFGPWLFRIAANELVDQHRRATRSTSDRARLAAPALLADPPGDPADEVARRDAAAEVLDAMNGLNPRYQRALSLRYLSGLTADEAARAMGTSKATMAVIVFRATRALRRAMSSAGPR
jgi:RNA polymerase sigma-70 factor (ECF subfamily)